jgi:hypothetical protein
LHGTAHAMAELSGPQMHDETGRHATCQQVQNLWEELVQREQHGKHTLHADCSKENSARGVLHGTAHAMAELPGPQKHD